MLTDVRTRLTERGISFREIPTKETNRLRAAWRAVFATEVLRRTRRTVHLGFDWHAFSYDFTPSLKGPRAELAYARQPMSDVVVIPDASVREIVAFACFGDALPDLTGLDYLVSPADFAWTMAFTHESEVGPFFAMAQSGVASRT